MASYPILAFEREGDPEWHYISMAVRMKLDLGGLKISLSDWQALPKPDRHALHTHDVETEQGLTQFQEKLKAVLHRAGRQVPARVSPAKLTRVGEWSNRGTVPSSVEEFAQQCDVQLEWEKLERYGRYVLWHLANKGDSRKFELAAKELTKDTA